MELVYERERQAKEHMDDSSIRHLGGLSVQEVLVEVLQLILDGVAWLKKAGIPKPPNSDEDQAEAVAATAGGPGAAVHTGTEEREAGRGADQ